MTTLSALVRQHPEWTATDVGTAIVAADGRFPPANEATLLKELSLSTELIPSDASVEGIRFVTTGVTAGPLWLVDVRSATRTWRLAVEPFRGHVIDVVVK